MRLRIFRWPNTAVRPAIDNNASDRIEWGISLFSRMVGPILLVVAIAATIWCITRWVS
jgi:hypothetical protein